MNTRLSSAARRSAALLLLASTAAWSAVDGDALVAPDGHDSLISGEIMPNATTPTTGPKIFSVKVLPGGANKTLANFGAEVFTFSCARDASTDTVSTALLFSFDATQAIKLTGLLLSRLDDTGALTPSHVSAANTLSHGQLIAVSATGAHLRRTYITPHYLYANHDYVLQATVTVDSRNGSRSCSIDGVFTPAN